MMDLKKVGNIKSGPGRRGSIAKASGSQKRQSKKGSGTNICTRKGDLLNSREIYKSNKS